MFFQRCQQKAKWSLFSPDVAPELIDLTGEAFKKRYEELEAEGKYHYQYDAEFIHEEIVKKRIARGMPYIVNKDPSNYASNQKNLGTIHMSNLCTEILEYTSKEEVAVCNLSSISLPAFVKINDTLAEDGKTIVKYDRTFDFEKLGQVIETVTKNLNLVIDRTDNPLPECKYSNLKNRPIAIGYQGLADCLILLRKAYDENKLLIAKFYEYLLFYATKQSCELAKLYGPYKSFVGSPISQGIFQFDMWKRSTPRSSELNWV